MRKQPLKRILLILAAILIVAVAVPWIIRGIRNDRTEVVDTSFASGPTVSRIKENGVLLVGTTGDYRPLSFLEPDGTYWGFDIDLAKAIAEELEVDVRFIQTSWPTLSSDVVAVPQKFDLAISGITITDSRLETMFMSDGYLGNGKTILCRLSDVEKFKSIEDIDKPEVRVMVNPGGTNEQFAKQNLTHSTVTVHQKNEEIPGLIAEGDADIMITEITEAPYYVSTDSRLAAPLVGSPFTSSYIGVLMPKGQEDLLQMVNSILQKMKENGSLKAIYEKYSFAYSF